jgi:hypothetical protein
MKWLLPVPRRAVTTLLALLAAACDESGPSGSSGSIALSASPAALSVPQGGSGSLTVTLVRAGGYEGTVSFGVAGLPAGALATVTPPQLAGVATAVRVDVSVPASVVPGSYAATVTAAGDGVADASAPWQLTVTVPDYELTVSPGALTIAPGESGSATVSVARAHFTGAVTLTLLDPPPGITGVFTPSAPTDDAAELAVSVGDNAAPGSYTLTVQGAAPVPGIRTTRFTVTVPGYAITLAPASFSVQRGSGATVSVTLARTQFTGGVSFALEGSPPGISGTFDPPSTAGSVSALTIAVGSGAAAGLHELRVRATASGVADRVAALELTVAAPAAGTPVEFLFCDTSQAPLYFAYQDGAGPWRAVAAGGSGGTVRYAFTLAEPRGGVLAVYAASTRPSAQAAGPSAPPGRGHALLPRLRAVHRARTASGPRRAAAERSPATNGYATEVLYASAAELAGEGAGRCALTRPTRTVSGTVQGITGGSFGVVSLGETTRYIDEDTENPVTFDGVGGGVVDLVGSRVPSPGSPPSRVLILRDLDLADGASLPATIDFDGPSSSVPATASVTVTGGGGQYLEAYSEVVTRNGLSLIWFDLDPSATDRRAWGGLAPAAMETGDFHGIVVFATPEIGSPEYRVAVRYVRAVSEQTLGLGPWVDPPTTTRVVAGMSPRFRFQGTLPREYDGGAAVEIANADGSAVAYGIYATRSYLGGSPPLRYDLTMPDVSKLEGFPALLTVYETEAYVGGFGFTGGGAFEPVPAEGTEFWAAARRVVFGSPWDYAPRP